MHSNYAQPTHFSLQGAALSEVSNIVAASGSTFKFHRGPYLSIVGILLGSSTLGHCTPANDEDKG